MKKKEGKKLKINLYEIIFLVLILGILLFIVFTNKNNDLKAHCAKAVCNEANTICYNYRVNENGRTIKTWEGNCSKLK